MVPVKELEFRYRPLHPGRHMHIPGYRQAPSTLHTTHAFGTCEVGAPGVQNSSNNSSGQQRVQNCTHGQHSHQRVESGDTVRDGASQGVGGQEQAPAPRGGGRHMHIPGYNRAPSTLYTPLRPKRVVRWGHRGNSNKSSEQRALCCPHGHHSPQRGESGDAVRDGATQGVGAQVQPPVPIGHMHTPGDNRAP
jgi:hypothetical protein